MLYSQVIMYMSFELLPASDIEVVVHCPTTSIYTGKTVICYVSSIPLLREYVERVCANTFFEIKKGVLQPTLQLRLQRRTQDDEPSLVRSFPTDTVWIQVKPSQGMLFTIDRKGNISVDELQLPTKGSMFWDQLPDLIKGYRLGWFNDYTDIKSFLNIVRECRQFR